MSDSVINLEIAKEEVVAYIEAESSGVSVEQVIRDLEIPGRLLPDILHDLVETGRLRVIDHLYYIDA